MPNAPDCIILAYSVKRFS